MVRISLKEAYDDRSVIKKIADLEANKQDKLTAGQGVSIDNNVINVDTSSLATKAALSAESAKLDRKIDTQSARLDARVDSSDTKIKVNSDAILTIEDELGSDALPGTIYYRITKVEGDVITLKPLVDGSIRSVNVEGDGSTVYHKALHNNGIVETDAIPVASETKAGVMSAGMYVGFNGSIQNLQARMSVLEGVGITYQLTGLSDTPSDAEITAAFQAQYPNVPLSAGIRAADYPKAKIWQYSGTNWIQLTSININVATSTALGLVKGSATSEANKGRIFVEVDGSMTVIGWDTLNALASSTKQSLDNLEPKVTTQGNQITALEEDVAANAADIVTLKGTSANHESRISSLETTSSDLRTRMGAAETDIDTLQTSDAQQTSKISALEADMNNVKPRVGQLESDVGALETKVNQHTQSISDIVADVNGLKTSKQDKLTAGQGVVIEGNTISVPGVQSWVETPIRNAADLSREISKMKAGDRIVGDAIAYTPDNVNDGLFCFSIIRLSDEGKIIDSRFGGLPMGAFAMEYGSSTADSATFGTKPQYDVFGLETNSNGAVSLKGPQGFLRYNKDENKLVYNYSQANSGLIAITLFINVKSIIYQ